MPSGADLAVRPGARPLRDVRGLLHQVQRRLHVGAVPHAFLGAVVADAVDGAAHDVGDAGVRFAAVVEELAGDLAAQHDAVRSDEGLARHPAEGIVAQHRVEQGVADLVRDLVGMPLAHRFAGEDETGHRRSTKMRY